MSKTWRERLEMKADDFIEQCECHDEDPTFHQRACQKRREIASRIQKAHITGLAEVLERVEHTLKFYSELDRNTDPARKALAALQKFREGVK